MTARPEKEFGKRGRVAVPIAQPPVKRSRHVALLLMGTFAIGGGAYALTPGENCEVGRPGMAADLQGNASCMRRGSSSGGGHGWWSGSSRSSFFSSDSASGGPASAAASDAGSGSVSRGGFGSFARAFSAHFSGGG